MVNNFPPDSEIFDIGGGNGFVAAELNRNGYETVLVEPAMSGVLNASNRNISNIICSTLEDACFKEKSISAIGLFDVLEHIRDDMNFLKNIHRVLIDNGRIYLTVPAHRLLWSNVDILSGHFRRYSKSNISNLLKLQGFRIEYCSYFFFFLPVPIFLFRVLPFKLRFHKNLFSADQISYGHSQTKKFVNYIAENIFNFELRKIKVKKKIAFGGSILVAAIKK